MSNPVYRQCNLCEAHCGIRVDVEDERVVRIAGDPDDVISRGYICPKAAALADLQTDPDRLRRPVKRVGEEFVEIDWDEALSLAAAGLRRVHDAHGRDALATYLGNPGAHSSSGLLAFALLRKLIGSRNNYSATSSDQLPQYMSSLEMFGHYLLLPVPDIERAEHLIVLGANPAVSNGSLMTAPGVRDKIKAICARGGKVVVVDPRRTETAKHASEHVAVRPGGDAYLLLGMLHVIFAEGLVELGHLAVRCDGLEDLRELAERWSPRRAAVHAGVEEETIVRLARDLAAAPRGVVYGRVGVCQQQTGSLTHWLINVLNIVTGNMDSVGGAMFPLPPVDLVALVDRVTGGPHRDRYRQRVSGLPEFADEVPVAGLVDEIRTPGEGQVKGMLIYAGNPVLSTPAGARLDEAMAQLEWCVAVDMYVTETTRHADVILPPLAQLERDDLDIVFPAFSVRNQVRYNAAAVAAPADGKDDWEILGQLSSRVGRGRTGAARNLLLRLAAPLASFERIVDLALRTGPYGRLRSPLALDVGKVKRARHGIDLGPLRPGLAGRLRTPGRRVRLAPQALMDEAGRLEELAGERESARSDGFDLTLIGRRSLRSNNSWMHNSRRLMKGADRCTALLHPHDAERRGLSDGQRVRVASTVGAIELPLELSDEMRPGVVSIPHGFGHGRGGVGWRVAASHAGASVNDITDPKVVDRLTGNAAFNDVAVRIDAVAAPARAPAELDAVGA